MSTTLEERYAPTLEEPCRPTLDERVREEVETLKSILMDDIIIKKVEDRPEIIETVIRPSTGCDVDQQYVCVTLEVTLPDRYPDLSPIVMLRNPRGLDDGLLETLHMKIKQMLRQHIGSVVIYSIVELLRGYLTNSNLPSGRCTICLFGFISGDAFIKTQCYHYFHKHCLANHLEASQQSYMEELEKLPNWKRMDAAPFLQTCPVCRSTVYYDVDTLKESPPPIESENATPFELTPEMRALQKKMAALLKKQEAKGGIVGTGDNGPPPLTITTAADFTRGPVTSGRGGWNGSSGRQQMNASPDGVNPSGSGRGTVSRRGSNTHPGPQNIAAIGNVSRGKTNGATNTNTPRPTNMPAPVTNVNAPPIVSPSNSYFNMNGPRGFTHMNAPRVTNMNAPRVNNTNAPRVTNMNAPRVNNTNAPRVNNTNAPRVNNISAPRATNTNAPRVNMNTPPVISPSNAYFAQHANFAAFNFNPGAFASANAGRGVISTAPPVAPTPAPETPGSPSGRPVYRGPYRGFNRRAKPGRRGQNPR